MSLKYSGTFSKGHSEYVRTDSLGIIGKYVPPYKGHFEGPNIDFPIVLVHFSPLKSGQPLHSGVDKMADTNVSSIRRSHCTSIMFCPFIIVVYFSFTRFSGNDNL